MGKERDPRDVDVHEIVEVIERYLKLIKETQGVNSPPDLEAKAIATVAKLVGPERESESRWSSRHIVVDEAYCTKLADSLAISTQEARDFFIGEPVRRAEKVAAWALDACDRTFSGLDNNYEDDPEGDGPMVHGRRGAMVADILRDWSVMNNTGACRLRQYRRQATPSEAIAQYS